MRLIPPAGRVLGWVYPLAQLYWRVRRPQVLGCRVLVVRDDQVAMVRHTYRPGWYLPGGALHGGESYRDAAARELYEETGLRAEALELLQLYFSEVEGKRDHVALYRATRWTGALGSHPSVEIAEVAWFPLASPPPDTSGGTMRRLREHARGRFEPDRW